MVDFQKDVPGSWLPLFPCPLRTPYAGTQRSVDKAWHFTSATAGPQSDARAVRHPQVTLSGHHRNGPWAAGTSHTHNPGELALGVASGIQQQGFQDLMRRKSNLIEIMRQLRSCNLIFEVFW